jgi:hypothetical protein
VIVHLSSVAPLVPGARVTARVFFQSTMRAFIEELANVNVTDQRGSDLKRIWQDTGYAAPRLAKMQTLDLQLLPASAAGAGGGSGSGGFGTPNGGSAGAAPTSGGTPTAQGSNSGGCTIQRGTSGKATPFGLVLLLLGLFGVRRARNKQRVEQTVPSARQSVAQIVQAPRPPLLRSP